MSSVLVTGGAGFIGSHLIERLLRNPGIHRIVAADNLSTGAMRNLPSDPRVRFLPLDFNRAEECQWLFRRHRFDHIFHLAAVVGVERTQAAPAAVLDDLAGIRHVLEGAARTGARHVYFTSSSEVYGASRAFPQSEDRTPAQATHPYALVKRAGEELLRARRARHGLPFTVFRLFNTYGPRQRTDFVVPRFVQQALAGDPITVDFDGAQRRTFCHVDDTVEAMARIFERDVFHNDIVNIGSADEIAMRQLALVICRLTGSASEIRCLPSTRRWDVPRRLPDLTKLRRVFPDARIPLAAGLATLIAHQRAMTAATAPVPG